MVYIGSRRTPIQYGEIGPGTLASMLRDLNIRREDFLG